MSTGAPAQPSSAPVGLANPSAQFCANYRVADNINATYVNATNPDNSRVGICINQLNGKYCEAFSLMRNECDLLTPFPNASSLLLPVQMPDTRTLPINRYNPYPCGVDYNDWY